VTALLAIALLVLCVACLTLPLWWLAIPEEEDHGR
jgi:hypothetical protein